MFWHSIMKASADVDDNVLQGAKEIAADRATTAGLEGASIRNGVPLMPRRPKGSAPITMETVNHFRDES
jgi:hypothetical protein